MKWMHSLNWNDPFWDTHQVIDVEYDEEMKMYLVHYKVIPKKEPPPMPNCRQTVTIEGVTTNFATLTVTLTRQQIEKAMEELKKSVEPTALERFQHLQRGDRFTVSFANASYAFEYLVTDPIVGERRFVCIESGVVCASTLKELARCYDEGRIVIHLKAR